MPTNEFYIVPKASLDATADAIRGKTGSQAAIEYTQAGFADAVDAIPTGGGEVYKQIVANVTVSEDTHGYVILFNESAKWRELQFFVDIKTSAQNTANYGLWLAKTSQSSDSGGITSGSVVGDFGSVSYQCECRGEMTLVFTESGGWMTRGGLNRDPGHVVSTTGPWFYASLAGGELDRIKIGVQNGSQYIGAGSTVLILGTKAPAASS